MDYSLLVGIHVPEDNNENGDNGTKNVKETKKHENHKKFPMMKMETKRKK